MYVTWWGAWITITHWMKWVMVIHAPHLGHSPRKFLDKLVKTTPHGALIRRIHLWSWEMATKREQKRNEETPTLPGLEHGIVWSEESDALSIMSQGLSFRINRRHWRHEDRWCSPTNGTPLRDKFYYFQFWWRQSQYRNQGKGGGEGGTVTIGKIPLLYCKLPSPMLHTAVINISSSNNATAIRQSNISFEELSLPSASLRRSRAITY